MWEKSTAVYFSGSSTTSEHTTEKDTDFSLGACRWLLRRIQGVFVLCHSLPKGPNIEKMERMRRAQQLALTVLPFLSGLLSSGAQVHLDLSWGTMPSPLAQIL